MTLDKKQVPQLAILGVLVIMCIGVVSFQVMRGKSVPVPAPSASVEAKADDSEIQSTSKANITTLETDVFPNLASVPGRRDPFAPQQTAEALVQTRAEIMQQAKNAQTARRASANVRPINIPSGRVPRIDVKPMNPFSQGNTPGALPVQVQEQNPQFVLTGVIRGDNNVAIIRMGSDGRHVVKAGQTIDGHYRVLSVSDDGAVLVNEKNRRIHVRLGGDKNAG